MMNEDKIPDFLVELAAKAHHDKSESWKAVSERVSWDDDLRPVQQSARLHMMRASLAAAFKAIEEAGFALVEKNH